jgi:predicted ArsR family transcriptional regulator
VERLALLKALGDNTRYAIYLEIARSPRPLATGDIAETLGLHANTVRPHLERMREVGLLEVEVDSRGSVGRPQHRYSLAPDAPSLGLEPPAFPTLARMLVDVVAAAQPDPGDVAEVGRARGRAAARAIDGGELPRTAARSCAAALVAELQALGYDPVEEQTGTERVIAFTHCPYRELAAIAPELVCGLHRGIVEGFVEEFALRWPAERESACEVSAFHSLADREPCHVVLIDR